MQAISSIPNGEDSVSLQIGRYSIDEDATAWLNGNKLFQRHAVIVGSTGSGKSWCVAKILEQVALLKSADAILFDIHGEYSPLQGDSFSHLKVAFSGVQLKDYGGVGGLKTINIRSMGTNQVGVFYNGIQLGNAHYEIGRASCRERV